MAKKVSKVLLGDTEFSNETLSEKILKQCHQFYTDSESGLIKIAKQVSLDLLAPRKKITVLLIGNHSAGKSSFVNWYIEEHIQKTGVAIETQGVTFVTSGKKRETFTGNATLHLYSHFEPLRQIDGVVDYLNTEISTSKQKKFNLVTFIDTPGLVDGDMKYPFDINKAILWLGNLADLIFVFFEPIGQALCKRTLDLVEELAQRSGDRMRFYLSKADEAGNEADRQKVLMQIVQEICKKPALNKTSFDMPTIYISNSNARQTRCLNQIDETCKDIEKTINKTVQSTLNSLENDCQKIASLIDHRLQEDQIIRRKNSNVRLLSFLLGAMGVVAPLFLFLCFVSSLVVKERLLPFVTREMVVVLEPFANPFSMLWSVLSPSFTSCTVTLLSGVLFIFFAKIYSRFVKSTLTKKQRQQLLDDKEYVLNYVKKRKDILYKEYLNDYVADHEM